MSDKPNPDWQEDVGLMKDIGVDAYGSLSHGHASFQVCLEYILFSYICILNSAL
jgi:hypothetical protein